MYSSTLSDMDFEQSIDVLVNASHVDLTRITASIKKESKYYDFYMDIFHTIVTKNDNKFLYHDDKIRLKVAETIWNMCNVNKFLMIRIYRSDVYIDHNVDSYYMFTLKAVYVKDNIYRILKYLDNTPEELQLKKILIDIKKDADGRYFISDNIKVNICSYYEYFKDMYNLEYIHYTRHPHS